MLFRLQPLRFSFLAKDSIRFANGKSANILRGAFGTVFRRLACVPQCGDAAICERRASCSYARMFQPAAIAPGPSGLADWPRPFVFRAMHLDGRTFAPGDTFHFDVNLFDGQTSAVAYLVLTFAELAHEGLGPGRRSVQLINVAQLNERREPIATIFENGRMQGPQHPAPLELGLDAHGGHVSRLRVKFLTPMELKSGHQIATRPDFGILAARVRDRISTLRELYGGGALTIDFRAFGERASEVKMSRCEITTVDLRRRSSRTGQVHPIGGFVGEAEYEGELDRFLPYLKVAEWTGVGRQTVFGKGAIEIDVLE